MPRSLVFFLLVINSCFAQTLEVITKTKFKHDYLVGYSYYVENSIDTSQLNLLAVVKVVSSNQDFFFSRAITLLNNKAKQLTGNAYKLRSAVIQDTSLILIFNIYFASEKQINLMKNSAERNKIVIFNNHKDTISRALIVDKQIYTFPLDKHVQILTHGKEINLKLSTDSIYKGTSEELGENKKALFFTIRYRNVRKAMYYGAAIGSLLGVGGYVIGILVAKEITEGYPKNNSENEIFSSLNYNTGRVLMDIYPLHQKIDTK